MIVLGSKITSAPPDLLNTTERTHTIPFSFLNLIKMKHDSNMLAYNMKHLRCSHILMSLSKIGHILGKLPEHFRAFFRETKLTSKFLNFQCVWFCNKTTHARVTENHNTSLPTWKTLVGTVLLSLKDIHISTVLHMASLTTIDNRSYKWIVQKSPIEIGTGI